MSLAVHHLHDAAAGPAVVLLHGFPLDSRMWHAAASHMHADVPVLAVDLPGLGASRGQGRDTPSIAEAADLVAAVIVAADRGPAVVAGLSMGGYVALALLERHPSLVAGLALVDTKAAADSEVARSNRLATAAQVSETGVTIPILDSLSGLVGATTRAERPWLLDTVRTWAAEQPAAGVAWSLLAMADRPDRTPVLAASAIPAVVIVGEEDELTTPVMARAMAGARDGVDVVTVPGAGHLSAIESPEVVAGALDRLVRAVSEG